MNIRAKFKVQSVTHTEGAESVALCAVNSSDGKGNESWAKWTPSGKLEMTINNPEAQGKFKPGKLVYLDFSDAD